MYFRLMGKLNARRNNLVENNEKGFTLIELLVVVIIIGILAAIAIPVYIGVQNNAKDSAAQSDLSNIKTAEVSYFTKNGAYVTDLSKLSADGYTGLSTKYTTAPTVKLSGTGNTAGFCVSGVVTTSTQVMVTDSAGVTTGSVCP